MTQFKFNLENFISHYFQHISSRIMSDGELSLLSEIIGAVEQDFPENISTLVI